MVPNSDDSIFISTLACKVDVNLSKIIFEGCCVLVPEDFKVLKIFLLSTLFSKYFLNKVAGK